MSSDFRPPYGRPDEERLAFANSALSKVEQYIIPGTSVLASLLVRALLSQQCSTAEAMWAIYGRIKAGQYVARRGKDLPSDVRSIVTEHNPPAGLEVTGGILHIDGGPVPWGDVVITLPNPLTMLTRFPATSAGHVAFLEFVRDEVHYTAEAKRQQLENEYSNATIENMVRGIKWAEARTRLAALSSLPETVRAIVVRVLDRELTAGSIEQIDDQLTPAICDLCDSFEQARSAQRSSNGATDAPRTFGELLSAVVSSESAYQQNIKIAERHEAQGSLESQWWRIQAGALCFRPDPERTLGVDRLEAVCQATFGSGLTAENLQRIRGNLVLRQGGSAVGVDSMTVNEAVDAFLSAADTAPPAEPKAEPSAATKTKRSTERGEGRAKLIAALTKHHKYADGSCLNLEPVGNNELARLAQVSESTASAFFRKQFGGHTKYRAICTVASRLVAAMKLLNQEFAPHHLFGAKPPSEDEHEDEE